MSTKISDWGQLPPRRLSPHLLRLNVSTTGKEWLMKNFKPKIMTQQLVNNITREISELGFSPFQLYFQEFRKEYSEIYNLVINAENINGRIITSLDKILYDLKLSNTSLIKEYNSVVEGIGFSFDNGLYTHNHLRLISSYELLIVVADSDNSKNIYFVGNPTSTDLIKELVDKLKLAVDTDPTPKTDINIICSSNGRFYTQAYPINFEESNVDFEDCYNTDLIDIDHIIIEKLSRKKSKGIVLLHGVIGSGKTTYLRRLIKNVKKKIIYLPPEMAHDISSPSFITFLMENPDTILFIEDAENILKSREAGGTQAISNLLNVTDGILSDALHLQIVCTFNCAKDDIDHALLRPGRLIAEYRFEELSSEKTKVLLNKIYSREELEIAKNKIKSKMTVAEIFNIRETLPVSVDKKITFGFTPSSNNVA